jgi:dihydrolipoamide dehydrogenase
VELDDQGFIKVDQERRTADNNIFAIGDAAGGMLLAHEAMFEGKVAAEVIAGEPAAFDVRAIPAVVYTDPQIAWCGLTEQEAKAQGREIEVARFPWRASGRALSMGSTEGLTKLILEPESTRILGVGIVGREAEALIAEGVLAVEMGAVARDLTLSIHPHPTLTETLGEAAEVFLGGSTHYYPDNR